MNVEELLTQSFRLIGRLDSEQVIADDMFADGIDILNNFMFSCDHLKGCEWTEKTSKVDPIDNPPSIRRWIIANVAKDLAPEYGRLESYGHIQDQINSAYRAVRQLNKLTPPTYLDTLPKGSGNKYPGQTYLGEYYSEGEDDGA